MNKKAVAPMVMGCAVAFIVATFLFFTISDTNQTPGNNEFFIGEEQFQVVLTYQELEEINKYLEMSGKICGKKAYENPGNFDSEFKSCFNPYIGKANELYEQNIENDYSIKFSTEDIILIEFNQPLILEKETYTYENKLAFRINL